ncbi:hypothetical protein SK667_0708 [Streptococcus mitis]|nr:hypothetical protein SK667_0708 [Streptococcus mitis]
MIKPLFLGVAVFIFVLEGAKKKVLGTSFLSTFFYFLPFML